MKILSLNEFISLPAQTMYIAVDVNMTPASALYSCPLQFKGVSYSEEYVFYEGNFVAFNKEQTELLDIDAIEQSGKKIPDFGLGVDFTSGNFYPEGTRFIIFEPADITRLIMRLQLSSLSYSDAIRKQESKNDIA